MRNARLTMLVMVSLLGCKREGAPENHVAVQDPAPTPTSSQDAAVVEPPPTWYRAAIRASDGVETVFFLGVPAPGGVRQAIFKVGDHEVRSDATFDGKTVKVPMAVHQTSVEATLGHDGILSGTFSTSWRAWGASSIPLTATKVDAPTPSLLATVGSDGAVVDLGEPRTVWRLAMKDSGLAKLVVNQTAPGDFAGLMFLDTGNIIYLAGNGRGDKVNLTGFDGTSGYRLELDLGTDRKRARAKFFGGHRLDWREVANATRGQDFVFEVKAKAAKPNAKIGLPDIPELAALEPGPLVVEMAGSWCSTCRNVAPFLVELYKEYQPRGLRMVTLLYEFTEDPAIDAKQAETFKTTYGVTWPVVAVPGSLDNFLDMIPSGLSDINPAGFPITLFLGADGSLSALHAGFPSPDAPDEFKRVAAEFRANIDRLLASPAASRP